MSIELNARFISELNEAFPRKNDLLKEGDDHIRLMKGILKNTLPDFDRPVNISADKLNKLDTLLEPTDNTFVVTGNMQLTEDSGEFDMGNNKITSLADPEDDQDAATKAFVQKQGVEAAWPIGSIYITVDTKEPEETLGIGEWEKFAQGRVLVSTGSDKDENGEAKLIALEAKGGNYNEALEEEHLAEHTHSAEGVKLETARAGEHTHNIRQNSKQVSGFTPNGGHGGTSGGSRSDGDGYIYADSSGGHTHEGTLSGELATTGEGKPHNNMMPWIGVHMYKRVK